MRKLPALTIETFKGGYQGALSGQGGTNATGMMGGMGVGNPLAAQARAGWSSLGPRTSSPLSTGSPRKQAAMLLPGAGGLPPTPGLTANVPPPPPGMPPAGMTPPQPGHMAPGGPQPDGARPGVQGLPPGGAPGGPLPEQLRSHLRPRCLSIGKQPGLVTAEGVQPALAKAGNAIFGAQPEWLVWSKDDALRQEKGADVYFPAGKPTSGATSLGTNCGNMQPERVQDGLFRGRWIFVLALIGFFLSRCESVEAGVNRCRRRTVES